jgi:hypothetical protein
MEDPPGTIARPRELLLVVLAGVALSILMTWPLATGLERLGRTLGTDADGQYSIWNIAWVAHTIVADPLRLFDANIFYPHKTTLAYSEANILPGLIGVPAYWLTKNPWLTLNVVLLFAFTSAYVCAYLLLRYLTGDRGAAAAGAIAYAFCPYTMSHLSHIQLLFTGGIPLSLLMLHRLADAASGSFRLKAEATNGSMEPTIGPPLTPLLVASAFRRKIIWRGVALGLALAAQALSCAYYGIFAVLMIGYATLVLAATRRLWRSAAYWTAIAAGAATSLTLVLPFFIPFLRVQEESGFARSVKDTAQWAAGSRDYFMSATHAHAWLQAYMRSFGPWSGEVLFPGFFALGLGAAGVIIALRRGTRERETALVYGSLAVLAFWSSFGPGAGLYRVLYQLPAFSFLRAPSRLGLVVVLCLVVFAAIALRRIYSALSTRVRNLAAAIGCAAAITDLIIVPLKWWEAPDLPSPYAQLAISPRAPVAEFPFYGERIAFPLHAQYMLFSTRHWMPLVNGYSDVIPADFREAAAVLDSFPSDDAFNVLARRRVRYIAIHWDMFAGRHDEIRRRLLPYAGNLKLLAEDPRMTLYEVLRYP